MAFIAYQAAGSAEEPGFAEPSLDAIEAQVSMAKAAWAQAYWFKRLTLAVEAEAAKPRIEERFFQGLHGVLQNATPSAIENSPMLLEPPHADEP